METIKRILLKIGLALYNTVSFVVLNVLVWRNNLWNEKKWTNVHL